MVHSWQSMLINSALLLTLPRISAQECQPLCWLDTQRTGRCQVSPVYMASLLDRLSQGSIWGEVATQNLACRSLNSSACSSPECNLHDDGSCMMRANWVGRKLGNASVGTKCGLLGQIMADEATCYQLEQSACSSFTLVMFLGPGPWRLWHFSLPCACVAASGVPRRAGSDCIPQGKM